MVQEKKLVLRQTLAFYLPQGTNFHAYLFPQVEKNSPSINILELA